MDTIQINQSIGAKPRIPGIALDADNVLVVMASIFLGVVLFYGMSNSGYGFRVSFAPGLFLFLVACVWVFFLRQGKPASYDVDFVQTRIFRKISWEPDFQAMEQFEERNCQ